MGAGAAETREVVELERSDDPGGFRATAGRREVPAEVSLRLLVNGAPLVGFLCLNQDCEALALGFLFTEGLIDSLAEVRSSCFHDDLYTVEVELRHDLDRERLESTRSMTSGCGRGVTYVHPSLDGVFRSVGREAVLEVPLLWERLGAFGRMSALHRDVGGVHSALFEGPQGSFLAEDIGRHNCVDRIAGALLRRAPEGATRAPGAGGRLLSSGRVSTEILTKCVRIGVEIVICRSAPTAAALHLAEDFGLTIVGYAKGARAVVYTGRERLGL